MRRSWPEAVDFDADSPRTSDSGSASRPDGRDDAAMLDDGDDDDEENPRSYLHIASIGDVLVKDFVGDDRILIGPNLSVDEHVRTITLAYNNAFRGEIVVIDAPCSVDDLLPLLPAGVFRIGGDVDGRTAVS